MKTVAIARGPEKAALAKKLGAHVYIDSRVQDPAAELSKLGGARVVLATASSAKAMTACLGGLAPSGRLVVVGADMEAIPVPPLALISKRLSVSGWSSGTAKDSQETMEFCALTGVRSMNEVFPLEKAPEAYEKMMRGEVRLRAVLTPRGASS